MTLLFERNLQVCVLASGSSGNATWIGEGRRGVLIDCGLSTRQVFKRLAAVGLDDARIEAVLLTHEHADHVGAAAILDRELEKRNGHRVPFYCTPGTARALNPKTRPRSWNRVTSGTPFTIAGLKVEPHSVPHDTEDPVCYVVEVDGTRAGVITDLGRSTRLVASVLSSLDIAVLEFNHDVEMLMEGAYPWSLKQRIRGPHGHLSNAQSAEMLEGSAGRLRQIVLAHLSEDNNRPEKALSASLAALGRARAGHVQVHVGEQYAPSGPFVARITAKPLKPLRSRGAAKGGDMGDADRQVSLFGAG